MYQEQVSFGEAIRRFLTVNYCNFEGRSSRSEYWWVQLGSFIFFFVLGLVLGIFGCTENTINAISGICSLALLLPGLGLCVRRLHDLGKSGWWLLIGLIPLVGAIILIVWFCQESQMGDNQYGPVPNMVER